ncbi:MAG: peroxiredoxin family protein, partial [Chitinophagaceae bacterium]
IKGITKEPLMASLFLLNNPTNIAPLNLFVEPGEINLEKFAVQDLNKVKIDGGQSNKDLKSLQTVMLPFIKQMNALKDSFSLAYAMGNEQAFLKVQQQAIGISNALRATVFEFARKNPTSTPAAFYVYQLSSDETQDDALGKVYDNFSDEVKSGLYGTKIKAMLDLMRKAPLNKPAPAITLNDPNGKPVSLSSFKGKYVLIDFWASWCGPCRQENPNVVAAYNKYKAKNFTILGVSLDDNKEKWTTAISADKLSWTHISDLQGWKSKAAEDYGVQSIPANFLLDTEGKIIAKNLRGADLDKKLAELLK